MSHGVSFPIPVFVIINTRYTLRILCDRFKVTAQESDFFEGWTRLDEDDDDETEDIRTRLINRGALFLVGGREEKEAIKELSLKQLVVPLKKSLDDFAEYSEAISNIPPIDDKPYSDEGIIAFECNDLTNAIWIGYKVAKSGFCWCTDGIPDDIQFLTLKDGTVGVYLGYDTESG